MIEHFELDENDLSVPPARQTRWDAAPLTTGPATNGSAPTGSGTDTEPDDEKKERGGIFLAALFAFLLPAIFVAAFVLSDTDGSTELEQGIATPTSTGLDSVGIAEGGAPELNEGLTPTTQSAESSVIERSNSDNTTNASDGSTDGSVETEVAGATKIADTGASARDEATEATGAIGADTPQASATTSAPATTTAPASTAAPATTAGPTTTSSPSDDTSAPTTPPTTAWPATTNTPTTTVSPPTTVTTEASRGPALAERIDIGQLGDTFVGVRFATGSTTSYRVVVLGEGRVIATRTGTAIGGQTVNVSVDGLTPGMDYNIQVSLNGPPVFTSAPVSFRTSGGAPEPIIEQVELLNLRIVETGSTRFELNYESNICANGSFTIRERGTGTVVGSNAGQAWGCTTRHLAIPGFWTVALKPNTTYVITVAVEAGGAGLGNGNTATQSMSVTTN